MLVVLATKMPSGRNDGERALQLSDCQFAVIEEYQRLTRNSRIQVGKASGRARHGLDDLHAGVHDGDQLVLDGLGGPLCSTRRA